MNEMFTSVDYVLMALYTIVLIGMGLYLSRRASGSVEDYFIGGRKLPWWMLGASGMAQFVDITGTALIISFLFMLGPKALLVELRGGACIHMTIILLWAGKWHRRSNCITGAEWMVFRFGNGPDGKAARIITALSMQIFTIGMVTYLAKGVGLFFSTFLPFSPAACSFVVILIACIYTAVSGFYGVVFTDLFQAFIIIAAVIVVSVMAINRAWFGENFSELAAQISGLDNWMSSIPQWKVNMPAGYENYTWLGVLAIFYLTKALINGLGGGNEPKFFGARNDRECGTLTFFWTSLLTFRWPLMIGVAILGFNYIHQLVPDISVLNDATMMIKSTFPGIRQAGWDHLISKIINQQDQFPILVDQLKNLMGKNWIEELKMLSYYGTVNTERILPAVILHSIPVGLKGLLIIALTAACMSTFDSNVNWAVGFITHDIYHAYLKPKAKNKELMAVSWISTLAIGMIGYYMAFNVKNVNDIWGWLMMALGTGFFVPQAIKFYWQRFNGWGFTTGMAMGVGGAIIQRIFWPELPEFYQFLAMAGLGLFGSIAGSLLTQPMDQKVLENFYLKTKPFGIWGKIKDNLDPELKKKVSREHFFDLVSVPFVITWHYLLLLLPMLFVIGNFREFFGGTVLLVIALTGMYFFWYKKLPKENYYED